jgi:hypothetical protein
MALDPEDENGIQTLQGMFSDWWHELFVTMEPYPERWAEMKRPIRPPHRMRHIPLLRLQATIATSRRRLAALLTGWID